MVNEAMLHLAKKLVEIPSINSTSGEKEIGIFIENYIREIPYFQAHPDQVIIQALKDDPLDRRSVFAILLGEKDNCGDTLLFHGHIDTVGLEGYGAAEPYACQPDILIEKLRDMEISEEVREDLESGDYMFGRGACDMKSGDAVFLELLKTYAEHPEELSGNIVVSFNPVEENLHTGIIEGLEILGQLQQQYSLNYCMAINNDFICPLYRGDTVKTIYTGTVGKLLPCFYIQGKETHVGQCFEGFDACMVAAELVREINMNREFSDEYLGEYSYPPSVLKMKDLKPWYNVQTAAEAFVYFNYFVHNSSMENITNKLKEAANKAFVNTLEKINKESSWFSKISAQETRDYVYEPLIYTYDELLKIAQKMPSFREETIDQILDKEMCLHIDKREVPIAVIRYLLQTANITAPAVVLYYAAPYCPHNTLQGRDDKLVSEIQEISKQVEKETGEQYRLMRFFPSLSDSSYLKIDDSQDSIDMLLNNFPGVERLYPIPLGKIKQINIPAINYGCYGKDAHKWTERVHIPYTFGVLPLLLKKTVEYYLIQSK